VKGGGKKKMSQPVVVFLEKILFCFPPLSHAEKKGRTPPMEFLAPIAFFTFNEDFQRKKRYREQKEAREREERELKKNAPTVLGTTSS